ncbi:histidine kinase [Streptomyces sp. NPDC048659]|uniref:sensor histidine kinase n=1 Tax=Streptomyces sp. NPDC048659 TaxID=3155489 RepID=UPI003435708D
MLYAILASYLTVTLLNILAEHLGTTAVLASMVGVLAVYALQLLHSSGGIRRAPLRRRIVPLAAQAALTFLPLMVLHWQWGSMGGLFAASCLLLLPPRIGWILFGLTGVLMMLYAAQAGLPLAEVFYMGQSTWLGGIVVYGISRLTELVVVVHETRGELARLAVTNERLRFARDLHDLLGYSLSAISLRSELIRRLLPASPERAREEVSQVLDISRQALADVRMVASGYRDMSLVQECASAREVLRAAEVDTRLSVSCGALPPAVDTVLATVLREAMTNMLRHSRVRTCVIEAVQQEGVVRLSVVNDGAEAAMREVDPNGGSGLGNLGQRVRAMGGTLISGLHEGGRFRLVATVPAGSAALAPGPQPLRMLRRLSRRTAAR